MSNQYKLVMGADGTRQRVVMTEAELNFDSAGVLEAWRAQAFMTKQAFCITLMRAGILPDQEAEDASGGEWPATFAAFLVGKTEREAREARMEWRGASNIARNHPMIMALAPLAFPTATDKEAQVDALFGWTDV